MNTRYHIFYVLIFTCLLFSACTSGKIPVGSNQWHANRLAEIQEAYEKEEITKAEYLHLKIEADKINQDYTYGYARPNFNFGFGYEHHNLK